MSLEELWNMTEGNRNLLDPTGWTAEKLEWLATIYLYGEKRVWNAMSGDSVLLVWNKMHQVCMCSA